MSADEPADPVEAEVVAWLARQHAARDPAAVVIRGVDGRIAAEERP
jgi:hypothetical protein